MELVLVHVNVTVSVQLTERQSKTAGEVMDPVTSSWVSPRCFLWSEVSNVPHDVTLWLSSMTHDPVPLVNGPGC